MRTVAEASPTPFDHAIGDFSALASQRDWLVAPCSQTRDSSVLERSNWQSQLDLLGGESDTLEIHRFGHWSPGWYELVIVAPERAPEIAALEERLDSCPALDEEAYCELAWTEAAEFWARASLSERRRYCGDALSGEALGGYSSHGKSRLGHIPERAWRNLPEEVREHVVVMLGD